MVHMGAAENITQVPGGILRFTFTVRLGSSTNSSYLEITTISGVILSRQQPWYLYQPASCQSNPCYLNGSVRFRFPTPAHSGHAWDACIGLLSSAHVCVSARICECVEIAPSSWRAGGCSFYTMSC